METELLYLDILPQPDDTTCGPTCLHAVYRYFGDSISLNQVISEVAYLEEGGTLAVYLASHALQRGYGATIYSYNLKLFDPTWFGPVRPHLSERLKSQLEFKRQDRELTVTTKAYLEFLEFGGQIRFEVLSTNLLRTFLKRSLPILTGLSATYLYNCSREYGMGNRLIADDIQGEPTGHFVVLAGYDGQKRSVLVADPLKPNPVSPTQNYEVRIDRLVCAIMLGALTHDANFLIIEPRKKVTGRSINGDKNGN